MRHAGDPAPLLPRFFHSGGVDLVNLGDCRAFMLSQDNLYNVCVAPEYRHYPIDQHYARVARDGYQQAPVTKSNSSSISDARYGIYLIVRQMIDSGVNPAFLDVGAYVGDVGIRYGNFFRTLGYSGRVVCFDPTLAGDLIPYNITLNSLNDYVEHRPEAVSDFTGLLTFQQRQGHADSSSATLVGEPLANTIVPCVTLSEFLRKERIESAFIKLDTENLEARILADIKDFLTETPSAVCFEFHAHQSNELMGAMTSLMNTHFLFDIGYLPRPFCFNPISELTCSLFPSAVARYPYGYTDVLALSRQIPGAGDLARRLGCLNPGPIEYSLVLD